VWRREPEEEDTDASARAQTERARQRQARHAERSCPAASSAAHSGLVQP
jgi:hypothetical protein